MALFDALNPLRNVSTLTDGALALRVEALRERLRCCLPPPLRRALMRQERCLLVRADGARAHLTLIDGETRESCGELALDERTRLPDALLARIRKSAFEVTMELPESLVLTRRVSLPIQARANLARITEYEIDRLSPFQAHQALHDFAIQPGAKSAARITIDLALCRRDQVASWIGRIQQAGVAVDRVCWPGAWPRANLLAPSERPKRRRSPLNLKWVFGVVILALLVAVMATPIIQKRQLQRSLERELKQARAQAVTVDDLRQELERARQGSTVVLQQKWERARIIDMLRELTDRLPDDTWIQNFEYRDDQVELRGESSQATALIALLEQAPTIDAVSFRSPVTQVNRTGKERFNIAFRFIQGNEP